VGDEPIGFYGVDFRYRGSDVLAVKDLSFELRARTTFLLGSNGAGKTTTFRLLLDQLKPQAGTISRGGVSGRRVGYCPQSFRLPQHLSAVEYLEYLAWLKGVARRSLRSDARDCLAAVGLQREGNDKIRRLSGGMRRKVGLAAALLGRPSLVLLDEPTVGLDPEGRALVRTALSMMSDRLTLLISTHIVEDIPSFGPDAEMLVLSRGSATFFGAIADLEGDATLIAGATALESSVIRLMKD
jgi:ABC-2 type transport system ATP-binding protein